MAQDRILRPNPQFALHGKQAIHNSPVRDFNPLRFPSE